MGDECNVITEDHDNMKIHTEGNLYIKDNKEERPPRIVTKSPDHNHQYSVGDTCIDSKRITFPYISTKLRAEAPPFTPDCNILPVENPTHTLEIASINQEYHDYCFVNVNLIDEDSIHAPDKDVSMSNTHPIIEEDITNENIKSLNETAGQLGNSILPEAQIMINTSDVVPESSPSVAIREPIVTSRYPPRSRILLSRFTFGNSTKIAVLIASIVVSVILIIYIFV